MKGRTKQTKTSDYTRSNAARNTPAKAVMEKVTVEPVPVKTGAPDGAPDGEGEDTFPEGIGIPALGLRVPEGTGTVPGTVPVRTGGLVPAAVGLEQTVHTVTDLVRVELVAIAVPALLRVVPVVVAVAVAFAPPVALLRKSGNFVPGLIAKTIPDLQCVP